MGLPIAIGSKSVSSYPVSAPVPIEEFSNRNDGTILVPVVQPRGANPANQTTIFFAEHGHVRNINIPQLQALIMVSYHDMLRLDNGDCEYRIAEIRIQVSFTAEPFSTIQNKETIHRIHIPATSEEYRNHQDNKNDDLQIDVTSQPMPQAIFSADNRFLTCLIPHTPESCQIYPLKLSQHTSIIIFQLRNPVQPTSANTRQILLPPVPTYIKDSGSHTIHSQQNGGSIVSRGIAPVATNPVIVSHVFKNSDDGMLVKKPILNVRSICDITTTLSSFKATESAESYRSFLLMGFDDGSIRAVSYRRVIMTDNLANDGLTANEYERIRRNIVRMDHISEWIVDGSLVGRLAVLYGIGTIGVYRSAIRLDTDSQPNGLDKFFTHLDENRQEQGTMLICLAKTHFIDKGVAVNNDSNDLDDRLGSVKWISGSYLAVSATNSKQMINKSVHVLALNDHDDYASVSSMQLSSKYLSETSNASFLLDSNLPGVSRKSISSLDRKTQICLQYDCVNDCLVISGVYDFPQLSTEKFGFAVIWNWRSNVQGLTIVPSSSEQSYGLRHSIFSIAADKSRRKKIVHILCWESTAGSLHIRKDLYDIGITSPPNCASSNAPFRHDSTLIMLPTSVCYPVVSKSMGNHEIEWRESVIPRSYGTLTLSAIGHQFGRSVAIAGTMGFCLLDCYDRYIAEAVLSSGGNEMSAKDKLTLLGKKLKLSLMGPRWIQSNSSFRVVAMTWWESPHSESRGLEPIQCDDILVVIVELFEGDKKKLFLACWSYRNVSLVGQLLHSSSCWGLDLPEGFDPCSIDVIVCPDRRVQNRKAVALITDSSYDTRFCLYTLQLIPRQPDQESTRRDRNSYLVAGRLASEASIGASADLFLAAASFAFRHDAVSHTERVNGARSFYVATIGALRKIGGGLSAIAVSSNHIVAIGDVIPSIDFQRSILHQSEIAKIWLGEILLRRQFLPSGTLLDMFVWSIQLRNGSLICWSVPIVSRHSDTFVLTAAVVGLASSQSLVHGKGLILGIKGDAGTMNVWMLQSSSNTRSDYLVGCVPGSSFGYTLGVGQHSKRTIRIPAETTDKSFFRPERFHHEVFCPCDFAIYPAASLPSMYASLSELASSEIQQDEVVVSFDNSFRRRLVKSFYRQSTLLSIRLLLLRSLEEISSLRAKNKTESSRYVFEKRLFGLLVHMARKHLTKLQFASLFLQIGRQAEPSCYRNLFPLPESQFVSLPGSESMHQLFTTALGQGSYRLSITGLPLFSDQASAKDTCALLFLHCLDVLHMSVWQSNFNRIRNLQDEKSVLSDVFCYALKLDHPVEDEDNVIDEEDRSGASSFLCGLPRILGFSRQVHVPNGANRKQSLALIGNGQKNVRNGSAENSFQTVTILVQYIISSVVETSIDEKSRNRQWMTVGALSFLLLGESTSTLHRCSTSEFSLLVEKTNCSNFMGEFDVERFFQQHIRTCTSAIAPSIAGKILDLLLLLLKFSIDYPSEVDQILVLLTIVVAHVAERVMDILSDDPSTTTIWTSYFNARFELTTES